MMKKYKANVKNKGPYVYEIPINKYPTETPDTCNIAFEVPIKGDQSRKIVIRFNTHPVFNVGLGAYTNDTRIYTANVPNSTNGANKKG
jgi:hypothetical protein